ncbi:MAG: Acetyltransferase domain [Candidatus Sumerlaeota bacterium]|nr:Acetyltransferase domain [Candidatus Sumerlaeota bacterium]
MIEDREIVQLEATGERVKLLVRRGGNAGEANRLRSFLGHKGSPYTEHVNDFLKNGSRGLYEGLEWRFYLAEIDGVYAANICTWEYKGVGLLGHVFTHPVHRRKGLARLLMDFLHDDFEQRGGHTMQLNTRPDSYQQNFYASLGYERLAAAPGSMFRLFGEDHTEPDSDVAPVVFEWRHWPTLHQSLLMEGRPFVRSVGMGIYGPGSAEGRLLDVFYRGGISRHRESLCVLEAAASRVVGCASILPDRLWGGKGTHKVLDVYVESFHRRCTGDLVATVLEKATGPLLWYREVEEDETVNPAAFGFEPAGYLPESGDGRDIEIWQLAAGK